MGITAVGSLRERGSAGELSEVFAGSMRRDGLAVACMGIDGQPL